MDQREASRKSTDRMIASSACSRHSGLAEVGLAEDLVARRPGMPHLRYLARDATCGDPAPPCNRRAAGFRRLAGRHCRRPWRSAGSRWPARARLARHRCPWQALHVFDRPAARPMGTRAHARRRPRSGASSDIRCAFAVASSEFSSAISGRRLATSCWPACPSFAAHVAVAIGNGRTIQEITRLHEELELERDYLREEAAQTDGGCRASSGRARRA